MPDDDRPTRQTSLERQSRARRTRAQKPPQTLGTPPQIAAGTITALHERRAGSARFLCSIDGQPAGTLSADLIGAFGLRVGRVVNDEDVRRLADGMAQLEVFDKAVDLLATRARSSRDLAARLRRAGAPAALIERALEQLQSLGLVDDAAFARSLAHSRVTSGGVSKRRIVQELQRRGVARGVADSAVADTLDEVALDEEGAARVAAEKRLRALRSYDPPTQRQRLYAFLARRGYDPDIIARVLRELLR